MFEGINYAVDIPDINVLKSSPEDDRNTHRITIADANDRQVFPLEYH